MRFALLTLLILSTCPPTRAHAGAWLREQGTSFTAVSFSATYFRDIANTTYLEIGLRENLTLGADIGYFTSRIGQQSGFATLFMRKPLGPNTGPNKWAYEIGAGATWEGELVVPHIKTGVSWGRGYQFQDMNGWMAVDASITWDLGLGLHLTKVDTTVGLNFSDTTTGMLQLFLGNQGGEAFGTFAPSVIYKPKKRNFRIQFGAETPLDNFEDTSLKLGLWREF